MTSVPETRIHVWGHSLWVDTQVLQGLVTFLGATFGVVLITLMAWVVLLVVR